MVLPLSNVLALILSYLTAFDPYCGSSFLSRTAAQELDQLASLAKHSACAVPCVGPAENQNQSRHAKCDKMHNYFNPVFSNDDFFQFFFP